jgi:putative ABC transport system substrate-binding protein
MNYRRKLILAIGVGALSQPLRALAQQQGKVWRIGYLDLGTRQSLVESGRYAALIQGLRDQGYNEGGNFVLEARYADGHSDRLDGLAAELAREKVDLIVSSGTPASHAAKRATSTIPIVVTTANDPVGDGFAASLARPGGNMTGLSGGAADAVQKLAELMIVAVPKSKRIAVFMNPANESHPSMLSNLQITVRKTGRQALPVSVGAPEEIERGFSTMGRERVEGVIILGDSFLFSQRAQIAGLALKHRLPSIYTVAGYAEAGGLMSYGQDTNDNFRRAGIFVNKILKGARPGDIPFEEPTRYYFVINRKTANALGVILTSELLARADKVIE